MPSVIERNNRLFTLSSWYVMFSSFDFRLTHFSTFFRHGFGDGLHFTVRTIFSKLAWSEIDVELSFRATSRVEHFHARSRRIRHESIGIYLISSRRIRHGSCWLLKSVGISESLVRFLKSSIRNSKSNNPITVVAIEMFQLKGVPYDSLNESVNYSIGLWHDSISNKRLLIDFLYLW